jgi:diacylglycerol kinase (ATP)
LWRKLSRSFGFAFTGLLHLVRTQRNARIQCGFAILAIALGIWLRISTTQGAIIALTIALVLILEAMNTAIEALVDLVQPTHHPQAKIVKDVAAAMVLIGAIASLVVGAVIFLPLIYLKCFA